MYELSVSLVGKFCTDGILMKYMYVTQLTQIFTAYWLITIKHVWLQSWISLCCLPSALQHAYLHAIIPSSMSKYKVLHAALVSNYSSNTIVIMNWLIMICSDLERYMNRLRTWIPFFHSQLIHSIWYLQGVYKILRVYPNKPSYQFRCIHTSLSTSN